MTSVRTYLKQRLPIRYVEAYRVIRRLTRGELIWPPQDIYQQLYERHSLTAGDADAVGDGPFDVIGRLELALLQRAGLQPGHTLVDFGCGIGRLAVHAIPVLTAGHYIGIEVSQDMLRRLDGWLQSMPRTGCRVSLIHQPFDTLPLDDHSADMLCAFSVFTHMEHEDTYRYLVDARRVVRRGGRLVLSCLTMETEAARRVFLESASVDIHTRWTRVRSVTTTREMIEQIAKLAGWTLVDWLRGDDEQIVLPDHDRRFAFGQSVAVLE